VSRSKQKRSPKKHSLRPYLEDTFITGEPALSHVERLLAGRIKQWSDWGQKDGYRKPGSLHGQTGRIAPKAEGERHRPNRPGTYKSTRGMK
jgi:hypothetical protein